MGDPPLRGKSDYYGWPMIEPMMNPKHVQRTGLNLFLFSYCNCTSLQCLLLSFVMFVATCVRAHFVVLLV